MATKVTKTNFKNEVVESKIPVLIDFWAPWCGPCRVIGPIIDQVSKEAEEFKVVKVNVDEEPELAAEYGVMSIPTLVVIKNGKVANKSIGAISKESVLALLD